MALTVLKEEQQVLLVPSYLQAWIYLLVSFPKCIFRRALLTEWFGSNFSVLHSIQNIKKMPVMGWLAIWTSLSYCQRPAIPSSYNFPCFVWHRGNLPVLWPLPTESPFCWMTVVVNQICSSE